MDSSPDPGIARSSGPGSARASLLAPAAVVVVGLAVTVLASGAAAVAHDASVRADMIEHAHTRIQAVARVLDSTATQVVALQALYRASGEVEPSEFDTFAATLLASGDAAAFEWVPREIGRAHV